MTTKSDYRTTFREAAIMVIASVVLGFTYTAVMGKGVFSRPTETPSAVGTMTVPPPEFVSFEEAKELYTSGNALFIDSRHEYDYKLGHIERAINLPLKEFDSKQFVLVGVARDRTIVSYCDGAECNSSIELAKKLSEMGFASVKIFFGGWNEWQSRNMTIEK